MATKKQNTDTAENKDAEGELNSVELVPMVRDSEIYPEPHTCDVHPDEVDNYALGGWVNAK